MVLNAVSSEKMRVIMMELEKEQEIQLKISFLFSAVCYVESTQ
jgi:hypothetical protein